MFGSASVLKPGGIGIPAEESVVMSKVRVGTEDEDGIAGSLVVVQELVRELPAVPRIEEVDEADFTDLVADGKFKSRSVAKLSLVGCRRLNSGRVSISSMTGESAGLSLPYRWYLRLQLCTTTTFRDLTWSLLSGWFTICSVCELCAGWIEWTS